MDTSAVTILDQRTTLRWASHAGDFVLWTRSINIIAPEAGVTIVDLWELSEGDRVTITTCAKDLPPWFELHPSEVCGGLAQEMLTRLANGYSPKPVIQAPNVWRLRAGDRLAWVGRQDGSSTGPVIRIVDCRECGVAIGDPSESTVTRVVTFGSLSQQQASAPDLLRCRAAIKKVHGLGPPHAWSEDWSFGAGHVPG